MCFMCVCVMYVFYECVCVCVFKYGCVGSVHHIRCSYICHLCNNHLFFSSVGGAFSAQCSQQGFRDDDDVPGGERCSESHGTY